MEASFAAQVAELQAAMTEMRRERNAGRPPRHAAEGVQRGLTTPARSVRPSVAPTGSADALPPVTALTPAAAQAARTGSAWPTDAMERLTCARNMRDAALISAAEYDSIKRGLVQGLASPPPAQPQQPTPTQQALPLPLRQQPPPISVPPWLLTQPPRLLAERVHQLERELELSRRRPPSPLHTPYSSLRPPLTQTSGPDHVGAATAPTAAHHDYRWAGQY